MPIDSIHREQAALEKRHWVRLTEACNNHCLFCLDSEVQTGRMLDVEGLREELRRGIAEGAERLILSGGEPTIHPLYIDLIGFGRELGYQWIQTVTNGRMFAYGNFAYRAVESGLNEATFSMHGHTPALHDRLVAVEGAFRQSIQGMQRLMAEGAVVNVDVVVNALNLESLPDILGFFMDRGITEFDLLWPVPFGRAWENRSMLFFEDAIGAHCLRKAIDRARSRGAVIWTNRLPPQLLEGLEDLIQDPHKLHDEVRGRREEFETYLRTGQPIACRHPDRCRLCFVEGFCRELERVREHLARGEPRAPMRSREASADPRTLDALLERPGGDIEVILNRRSVQWLQENAAAVREQASRLLFSLETFMTLSEVDRQGVNPVEALRPLAGAAVRLINLPGCFLPGATVVVEDRPSIQEGVSYPGEIDLDDFVEHFILHRYRVFSTRCRGCAYRTDCPGMPINHVRRFGFEMARPQGS
jgi:molybdenum cofactor biosynthesis enzyme MoaA